jgi:glycosyltransferase involved in cell wall biosynthesis
MQRISVVVPAYNAAATIVPALRSALAQSRPPDEVIVVDDGSQDGTADLIERELPDVKVLRQTNAGPSAARNTAAQAAQGDWLAFLDADDVWLQEKLALQLAALSDVPGIGMCSSDWMRSREKAPPLPPLKELPRRRITFGDIVRLNRFQTSTVLVRRELWQAVGGFRTAIDGTEDWDFWMRVSQHTDDLHLAWPLVVYRDEGTSYSKNSRRVYDAMHRMLAELGPPDGPIGPQDFRRLIAWHDVRFAYAFWRLGRKAYLQWALRHGRQVASGPVLVDVALREFLPYLWRRARRPFGR